MRINLPAEREEVPRHMVTPHGDHCAYYPVEQTVDLGKLSFPSSEREKVKSPSRSRKDPAQIEVTGGDMPDDDVESVSAQMPEIQFLMKKSMNQ